MTNFQAFILGLVQGLTEFLPVSSTGHILIAQHMLGIKATPAVFAFAVLVQLGTLVSLVAFYWKDFLAIAVALVQGIIKRDPFSDKLSRLGWYVGLASIPALGIGYLMRRAVEGLFREPLLEAGIRLVMTSLLLVMAELISRGLRHLDDLNWKDALVIGFLQVLSVFPGASRSGSTIAGGMLRNLDRASAARFAFLMSAPVMLVAGAYQTLQVIQMAGTRTMIPFLAVGFVCAAVVGWFALRWLIKYIRHHSLYPFAIYTAVVGLVCLAFQFLA
jgi:undecaprenyl-diphosphatase